jgi:hypothetical protein
MTDDQGVKTDKKKGNAWVKWGGYGFLLLGVILLVVWSAGLVRTGLSLWEHLSQAQALADAPQSLDPMEACDLIHGLRDDLIAVRRQADGLIQLPPLLGWFPKIGGDLRAVPHLLIVADGLTEAGVLGCDAMEPALEAFGGGNDVAAGLSLEQVARLLSEERASLDEARMAVERAQSAWAQVDRESLSPWVAEKTALLERGLPLLQAGLSAAIFVPDLLGVNEPRTYLVMALNEDELRATGGFISGVGEVRLEAGQLISMTFRDSYAVDDFHQPYPEPPEPVRRFMGIGLWVFRDSNWSPDFPTSARQAIALYRPGHPVTVDGVIALDQRAVQELVSAVGPLSLEGVEEPVTGEGFVDYIRQAWSPEGGEIEDGWWPQRKSFMGLVAKAMWQRVQSGGVDYGALARTLLRLLDEKHVLIYVEHPDAAALLAGHNWDGALRSGPSDFLMVLDTNMGYNKVNPKVEERIVYRVDLAQSPPQATLTLVYTHTGTVDVPCEQAPQYGKVYEDMMERCYWDYVRVYTPQGSGLLDATRIPVAGDSLLSGEVYTGDVAAREADEGPWLTLEVLGLVPPATTQTRSFTWTLPIDVVEWQGYEGWYSLWVQKQPGTSGHPLIVEVRLPGESVLVEAVPEATIRDEVKVIYRTALDRDQEFKLHFRRQR